MSVRRPKTAPWLRPTPPRRRQTVTRTPHRAPAPLSYDLRNARCALGLYVGTAARAAGLTTGDWHRLEDGTHEPAAGYAQLVRAMMAVRSPDFAPHHDGLGAAEALVGT